LILLEFVGKEFAEIAAVRAPRGAPEMTCRLILPCLLAIAFGANAAVADDAAEPPSHQTKSHAQVKKGKPDAPAKTDGMETIDFSRPNESPLAPKPPKSSSPPEARGAPAEPQGGVSLDMKWHATNDKADPFDSVRHSSGPNGPGDAIEGGFKLGF